MHVFLLGGTGSIGSAILDDLVDHGHDVTALARSDLSARDIAARGAAAHSGDLKRPEDWALAAAEADAVVHAAQSPDGDMGAIDRAAIEAIADAASGRTLPLRFVYTGGCWLYGETGKKLAEETTPFDPLPSFAWMVKNWRWLSRAPDIAPVLIHPAMVWDEDGGVLSRYMEAARHGRPIEIWGTPEATWPLVHRTDLASAYRLALETAPAGQSYCVAAEAGVTTGALADAIAARFGSTEPHRIIPVSDAVAQNGDWAAGPALTQRMSGEKIRRDLGWTPSHQDAVSLLCHQTG